MSVATSWDKVKGDMDGHGVDFLLQLFATHPKYQDMFPKLKGKSAAALKTDAAMKAQASGVMNVINACVNAGGAEGMRLPLATIAESHVLRGIKSQFMQDAFDCFIVYVAAKAGGDKKAWGDAVKTIMTVLKEEFKKAGE